MGGRGRALDQGSDWAIGHPEAEIVIGANPPRFAILGPAELVDSHSTERSQTVSPPSRPWPAVFEYEFHSQERLGVIGV